MNRRRADGGIARGIALGVLLLAGCGGSEPLQQRRIQGGEPARGRALIAQHGCTACHQIPGINTPAGSVGPALAGFARRAYIAGQAPNRPDALVRWLRDPPAINPGTAMPSLGLDDREARHIAAYLYTLR